MTTSFPNRRSADLLTQVREQPFPLIHPEDDAFVSMISDPIDEQRGRLADSQKPLGLGSNRETRTGMRVQNTLNIRSGLMDSPMNDEARLVDAKPRRVTNNVALQIDRKSTRLNSRHKY